LAPSSSELPSKRLERLKQELDDLERELRELEKEEIPTQIKEDPHSTKHQMGQVNTLRTHMQNVLQSTNFQDLESHAQLDFYEILNRKRVEKSQTAAAEST